METVGILFHAPLLAHHTVLSILSIYYDSNQQINDTIIETLREHKYRYLTTWNLILQTTYLNVAILCYVLYKIKHKKTKKVEKNLRHYLKFVNVSILSPLSVYIVMIFWMLFTVDRDIIFPEIVDVVIKPWMNHSMHTVIVILPLGEIFIQRQVAMPRFKYTCAVLTFFLAVYISVLYGTGYSKGVWLYPFLENLKLSARILFAAYSYIILLSLLTLTTTIHRLVYQKNASKL